MGSSWEVSTLEEVCALITDGAHFSPKEDPSGLPMASVKDLTRHGIDFSDCKRISKLDFDILKKQGCKPEVGDVLIAKDGNTALDTVCVYRSHEEVVLLSSVAILRPNKKVLPDFLRYYLDAPSTRMFLKDGFRSGSAIPRVILKDFRRTPITLPSLAEQEAIVRVLCALDNKIRLNEEISNTLELIASAVFKSWFIRFDPVSKKSKNHVTGFPKALDDLFPNKLEGSVMGPAPAGWKVGSFGDFITQKSERVADRDAVVLSAVASGRLIPSEEHFTKRVHSKEINK